MLFIFAFHLFFFQTLDPVKFADEETILKRSVGVLSSICGLVVVASLIGRLKTD